MAAADVESADAMKSSFCALWMVEERAAAVMCGGGDGGRGGGEW